MTYQIAQEVLRQGGMRVRKFRPSQGSSGGCQDVFNQDEDLGWLVVNNFGTPEAEVTMVVPHYDANLLAMAFKDSGVEMAEAEPPVSGGEW